jgi:hypothetical protein
MNGAKKALFALGAAAIVGGSMFTPISTASAQMTQCETFVYNFCMNRWNRPGVLGGPYSSPADCYNKMVVNECPWPTEGASSDPLYRKAVAKA